MTRTLSGHDINLRAGAYTAHVVSVGAALASLTFNGRDVTLPFDPNVLTKGYFGKTLAPWPNRITEATYTWNGERMDVPRNEIETGAALHGLVSWTDWTVVHSDSDSATMSTFLPPQYGYPFALDLSVTYALSAERGLSITIYAKNVGSEPAPYGCSHHPYITIGQQSIDAMTLTVPAGKVFDVDKRLAPVELKDVEDLDLDFRSGRLIGSQSVDHAFTELPDGTWQVSLCDEGGSSVSVTSDAPWVQVYSGDQQGRIATAVEPMTCPPDAFNSGIDLIVLEPGEDYSMTFMISADFVE